MKKKYFDKLDDYYNKIDRRKNEDFCSEMKRCLSGRLMGFYVDNYDWELN